MAITFPKPPRPPFGPFLIACVIGATVGAVLAMLGVAFLLYVLVELVTAFLVCTWLLARHHSRHPMSTTITPAMVEHPDELHRHAAAQAYNTGKSVLGWYDATGQMHLRDRDPIRVPIVRVNAAGAATDGTAEVRLVQVDVTDQRSIHAQVYDARDLDGKRMKLRKGDRFKIAIDGRDVFGAD